MQRRDSKKEEALLMAIYILATRRFPDLMRDATPIRDSAPLLKQGNFVCYFLTYRILALITCLVQFN